MKMITLSDPSADPQIMLGMSDQMLLTITSQLVHRIVDFLNKITYLISYYVKKATALRSMLSARRVTSIKIFDRSPEDGLFNPELEAFLFSIEKFF